MSLALMVSIFNLVLFYFIYMRLRSIEQERSTIINEVEKLKNKVNKILKLEEIEK